jgi:hypothetical protein
MAGGQAAEAPMAGEQKSSNVVVLALMGAAFAGAWWYNRSDQPLLRNRYLTQSDCECDYGAGRCSTDGGNWLGPWYLSDPQQRARDSNDPGPGGSCGTRYGTYSGGGSHGFWRSGSSSGYRGPIGTQDGYRRGFGGTARIGRAGG